MAAETGNALADLSDEQRMKLSLLRERHSLGTSAILSKVREQNNISMGEAIDYVYGRMENRLEPMTCKGCHWLNTSLQKPRCYNSNWVPADDIENAACGGISWEARK